MKRCDSVTCSEELEDNIALNIAINLQSALELFETQLIRIALGQAKGNISHAARLLGVNRTTLHEKMRRHHI